MLSSLQTGWARVLRLLESLPGDNGKTVIITGNLTSNSVNTKAISINGVDVASQINPTFFLRQMLCHTLQQVTEQGASTYITCSYL
jgi:hypothetical protein